jgi:hypothetical protein
MERFGQPFSVNQFTVRVDGPLGEQGRAGANLFRATALPIECIVNAVVKERRADDGDMKRERQVLEDCNEKGHPILTGDGKPYYIGSCPTDNGGLRLVFRAGDKSLASHFGTGDNTIVTCRRQKHSMHDTAGNRLLVHIMVKSVWSSGHLVIWSYEDS